MKPRYANNAGYAGARKALSGAEQGVGGETGCQLGAERPHVYCFSGPHKGQEGACFLSFSHLARADAKPLWGQEGQEQHPQLCHPGVL